MNLTLILLGIGGMLLFIAIRSLRALRLKEGHALLFLSLGLPFFGLAVWPDAVGGLAAWLGIEYQTVLLLAVTTFFLLMNFKLLSIISRHERRIASLAQMIGILTHREAADTEDDAAPGVTFEQREDATAPLPLKRRA